MSPGPASAPSSFSWKEPEDEKDPGKPGRFDPEDIKMPPLREESRPPKEEPRSDERAAPCLSLPQPKTLDIGLRPMDSSRPPPTPGFAPRNFESHGPFGFPSPQPMDAHLAPQEKPRDEPKERTITLKRSFVDESALMSPREEEMTSHPLREGSPPQEVAGMSFIEGPRAPAEELFSPRTSMFSRDRFIPFGRPPQVADPRSPPTKGETPIVRSIDELL